MSANEFNYYAGLFGFLASVLAVIRATMELVRKLPGFKKKGFVGLS